MVAHWFHWLADFATTWLPLAFFVVIALTAWLLWRTAGMMPRVKPANMSHGAKSTTSWADVAGVEEVRGELMEVVRDRVRRHGDLFEGVLTTRQRLEPALRALR